jgi:hypothetical protein
MAKVKKSRCPKGSIRKGSRCVKKIKSKPKSIKKIKSKPKSIKKIKSKPKSVKKTSPKKTQGLFKKTQLKVDDRGCSRQTAPKYNKRNSPPYPANQCCGRIMKGNDGEMYVSKGMSGAGHCRWVKLR